MLNRRLLERKCDLSNLDTIKEIDLSWTNITQIEANVFEGAKSLQILLLNNNQLSEIGPNAFTSLSNLTELKLNNNKIKLLDPDVFNDLNNLVNLELIGNQLKHIDGKLFKTLSNLKILRLDSNKIESIDSEAFDKLISLERLEININKLTLLDPKWFESLLNLKFLYVAENKLSKIESGTFKGLSALMELSLRDNEIAFIEPNVFDNIPNLRLTYLWNNRLEKIEPHIFKGLSRLGILWMHDNNTRKIFPLSFTDLCCLTTITISFNYIERLEVYTFKGLHKLVEMNLQGNRIEDIHPTAFEDLSSLKVLKIDNNKLKIVDPKCFKPLKSIQLIEIHDNLVFMRSYFKDISDINAVDEERIRNKGVASKWDDFLEQFNEIGIEREERKFEQAREAERLRREAREKMSDFEIERLNCTSIDIEDPFIGLLLNERYKVKRKLGRGRFGDVYLIFDKNMNQKKAIKIMDPLNFSSLNEPSLLLMINQENIIRYFDHFDIKIYAWDHICLITEFCENGDLKKRIDLKKQSKETFSDEQILKWMTQSTNALKFLHSSKIIHRDIKPGNMLLTKGDVIKLADLGIAKLIENTAGRTFVGSPAYMSPEIFLSLYKSNSYSFNTDIWSLGCVLYELKTLEMAFPQGQRDFPKMADFKDLGRFSDVISKMLEIDPVKRIDSSTLYELFIGME